ncbi:MAG: FMN-binding glutamate synthase family protein [Acidobacteriota bacterium]
MIRRWFFALAALLMTTVALLAMIWLPILWSFVLIVPLVVLGVRDAFQAQHTVLRNFPVIGHVRYLFEAVRPEMQQYFIESNVDAYPIEREFRSLVYQRAKGALETRPFGTQRDVYRMGYEWVSHSLHPVDPPAEASRVRVGGPACTQPYSASLLNTSAMSFGALSKNAVLALNRGAAKGGFAHNTGEGGISCYHLQPGGDLIWQVGTGYFGCRTCDGEFDPDQFARQAARESVRMIELKLSQGAKPGHGGILPAVKVSQEIARIRGVAVGKTVYSPPGHGAFSTPRGLLEFISWLRQLAGGKPVGFKLCIGSRSDFFAICKAMRETGITPDFIAVDGGEGGTGAAPLEFSNSVGMPARDAWIFVHSALRGVGLRDRIRIIASGKILTGFHMIRALALGADLCASARGMMFALGCIQALRCNTDHCPTGITTQNPALVHGLHVASKAERVARFHQNTIRGCLELLGAMGVRDPARLRPNQIFRRVDDLRVRHFGELYEFMEPGQLLAKDGVPENLRAAWQAAHPEHWGDGPGARHPGDSQ